MQNRHVPDQDQAGLEEPRDLRLFVNGVPSRTAPQAILKYFSQFGQVKILRLDLNSNPLEVSASKIAPSNKRGFCVLVASDKPSFDNILSHKHHFLGRDIGVNKFRQGEELAAFFASTWARKVLAKKIPISVTVEECKQALEAAFGPVAKIFRYETESAWKPDSRKTRRRTYTCSIEFESQEAAAIAVEEGFVVLISGMQLHLEKFEKQAIARPANKFQASSDRAVQEQHRMSRESSNSNEILRGFNTSIRPQGEILTQVHSNCDYNTKPTSREYHDQRKRTSSLPGGKARHQSNLASVRFNLAAPRPIVQDSRSAELSLQASEDLALV